MALINHMGLFERYSPRSFAINIVSNQQSWTLSLAAEYYTQFLHLSVTHYVILCLLTGYPCIKWQ